MSGKIVECVPNFSEGRRKEVIDSIAGSISSVEGVELLDVDPGSATNRTVFTFAGEPERVLEAAFQGIRTGAHLIDMRRHKGEHPRLGAADVVPFVPVRGVTMEECVTLARRLGERVARELGIPVYLYEEAATCKERRNLADIRKGEYEGLEERLKDPLWMPDFGEPIFNPLSGASVIGAREFLIAYNVNINSRNRKIAHQIALTIREKGRAKRDEEGRILRDEEGNIIRIPGHFKNLKAVGWVIEEYGCAQISMNITNYCKTPLYEVYEKVMEEASKLGAIVTGSEIVGLVPLDAILSAGRHFLKKQGRSAGVPEEEIIDIAERSLGLNSVAPFDHEEKIIEYRLAGGKRWGGLLASGVREFVNQVSINSPAPGGGSVAALCGALSSALASMVANLTTEKSGYEEVAEEMKGVAEEAQELKDTFLNCVNEDTEAFNRLMDAMRMKARTEEEKAEKEGLIEERTRDATLVPLMVLRNLPRCLSLALNVVRRGLKSSLSDGGVGGAAALASAYGAYFNILINLPGIRDEKFREEVRKEAESLLKGVEEGFSILRDEVRKGLT